MRWHLPSQNSPSRSPNPLSYSSNVLVKLTDPSYLFWNTWTRIEIHWILIKKWDKLSYYSNTKIANLCFCKQCLTADVLQNLWTLLISLMFLFEYWIARTFCTAPNIYGYLSDYSSQIFFPCSCLCVCFSTQWYNNIMMKT